MAPSSLIAHHGAVTLAIVSVGAAILSAQGCSPEGGVVDVGLDGHRGLTHLRAVGASEHGEFIEGGARYPVNAAPRVWVERQKLLASDGAVGDGSGTSVSLNGDTALVGAPRHDQLGSDSGSAYAFVRTAASWAQQDKLVAGDGAAGDSFGFSVSVSGDTALVGADGDDDAGSRSGSAYVFVRTAAGWAQQDKLVADDAEADDHFGFSVSVSGDTALVGAYGDDDAGFRAGSAYVFVRTATSWAQQGKLQASDGAGGDSFGHSIALEGDTALVGAAYGDGPFVDSGAAYVFVRTATSWAPQGKLQASDGAMQDYLGWSVSLSGDAALVGAYGVDDSGDRSGSAYAFVRTAGTWTQQGKLLADDGAVGDRFGHSVSIYGAMGLVGSIRDDDAGLDSGSAYVFARAATSWGQLDKLVAADGAGADDFGRWVSLGDGMALVGARGDDDLGGFSGSAYLFALRLVDGDLCSSGDDCVSEFCVDGYCCDGACGDSCEACDVVGLEGVCTPVDRGTDPAPSCGGYLCDGARGGCPTECAGSEDCASGYRCPDALVCVPKDVDGERCVGDNACLSGHCVDGVCCAQTCDEGCGSCVAAGHEGACTPLAAGEPGTPSCSPYLCAGADTGCPTGCAEQGGCASGYHCADGGCQPDGVQGAACTDSGACTSGHCTDGVCCIVDDCGAYRCGPAGVCEAVCSSSAQCATGHECSSTGKCELVLESRDAANETGACHFASASTGGNRNRSARWPAALAWLACLALVRRRRRLTRGERGLKQLGRRLL